MVIDIIKKFNLLLQKFLPKLLKGIKIDYGIGSAVSITNAKIDGKKTNTNPLSMTKKDQKANINIIETLIKDVNSDVAKKINYLVNKSVTEKWDNKILQSNLQELFNKDVPGHFDYKNRFETIAKTESFRIMNNSAYNTAERLKAKGKYLFNLMDRKTGEDSKISEEKYGSEEQAIPLDEFFEYTFNGKKRKFLFPPDRPNDRSQVYYIY